MTRSPMQDAAECMVKAIAQHESYVTVLFNNAGIMGGSAEPPKEPSGDAFKESYSSLTDDDFQRCVALLPRALKTRYS